MGASKSNLSLPVADLTGGLNDTTADTHLPTRQSPRIENWDLDRGALTTSRGSIKFGNQVAPRSAVRCKPDPALSPLYFDTDLSVPLRGYVACPYNFDYDIGGRFDYEGDFDAGTETFHIRRGRSFQIDASFRIPEEERLYEAQTRGLNAPAIGSETAGLNPPHGFDVGLDDCTIILQKGGDEIAPMSWAIGLVNIGDGTGLTSLPSTRPTNYALVFMWFDAPQCGESSPAVMRYTLTSGAAPSSGAYSTQAFRAVLIHKYVEPGRDYSVAVQVSLDTGTQGGASANTAWNHDGTFKVWVREALSTPTSYTFLDSSGSGTASGLEVFKGPTDSLRYLCKYGIRFAGRDMTYLGLGMRSFPWQKPGFLPYGADCASLKYGGFQMLDWSANTTDTVYGAGIYTLTVAHVSGDAYVKFNHQYGAVGNTNGGISPYAIGGPGGYTACQCLGNGGTIYNADALRHYRLVVPGDTADAFRGGVLDILTYSEGGGEFRLSVTNGATAANFGNWAARKMAVQAFRWNQRQLDIGEVRIWTTPRAFDSTDTHANARRLWDLGRTIDLEDHTNYDLSKLQFYLPCDDSEGTVLREKLVGGARNGQMSPFGLGSTEGGIEGQRMVWLSGEGEAPCIDFSSNPVVLRELKQMLAGTSQGFAIEISGVFPKAYYAIQDNTITLPGLSTTGVAITGSRPRFVPDILSWDVKQATQTGFASTPRPLISLTHRGALASTNSVPFKFPMGFSVEVANVSDNENQEPIVPSDLQPFYLDGSNANHNRYAYDAPWVGKNVTIQIGVQSTGTADQYDVYIALTPKDAFLPASGDPGDAEFAYFTKGGQTYTSNADYAGYFSAAHLTIKRKDLVRSVITIGKWNCGTLGYAELQPCMLIDKVRVFGCSASGALPTANGGILTSRNGKLEGDGSLPQRELTAEDILRPVAPQSFAVNTTDGSATIAPHGTARFFTGEARTVLDSIKETYLYVQGETQRILTDGSLGSEQEQLYRIAAVASDGASLTLAMPYIGATRTNAYGASLRLLAYTAFADDIRDKPLSLGPGKAFQPGTTTVADVVISDDFWLNKSPVTGNWKLRIYSPFGRTSLFQVLPEWVRGVVAQRHNPVRGIYSHNDRTYATVQGSIFEGDDRWRDDGPSDALTKSLAFRSRIMEPGVSMPLAHDRVEFTSPFAYAWTADATVYYLDAWVLLDQTREYQTIFWVGDPETDASAAAGSSGHRFHWALRLNRGRPELVMGSTATAATLAAVPEKGLYIATGASPIAPERWTHIRFALATRSTGAILLKPQLKVNGRKVSVAVNATDADASITQTYDWLRVSTLVSSGASGRTLLGVGRDAYRVPVASQGFASGSVGLNVQPNRLWGFMHSLSGRLAETVASQQPAWTNSTTGADAPDFDPFALDYAASNVTLTFRVLSNAEGVGHKVYDSGQAQYGVIQSHPFVSVWHELGATDQATSFAEYGTRLVISGGAKPAIVRLDGCGPAGVPAPTTVPSFAVQRFPVWKPNVHSLVAESATNDPVLAALAGAATQVNHYDNHGNNYWRQVDVAAGTGNAELAWVKVASTTRFFAFKAFVKPRKVAGRIVLWAMRNNVDSGGPFVEIRDGKLVMGWFDALLKKEVFIDSGAATFVPGQWHYVSIRKEWPQGEAYGNWNNSYFANGKLRRIQLSVNGAGTITTGDTITIGAATGRIVYTPSIAGGVGAYAANQLTSIEYVKITVAELAAGNATWTGSGATNTAPLAPTRPTHDSMILRHFGTTLADYTDVSRTDPTLAKVGVLCQMTITGGTRFVAGDTLTGATSGVGVVLWAHTKGAITATVQNVCIYFTSSTTFVGNVTGGGVTNSTITAGPTAHRDCISFVIDDRVMTAGGASGWVTRGFASNYFTGAAAGVVNAGVLASGAVPFHPGMVGMYWMWGSIGGGTASMRGKLYRITSVSEDNTQINTVIAGTSGAESFAGFVACEGGVFCGTALHKSDDFDNAKLPDTVLADPRAFGHEDAANEMSGISPFDGEWACPGWTCAEPIVLTNGPENVQPFEVVINGLAGGPTVDPIQTGTDDFAFPIFAIGEPGRLRYDTWAASPRAGTFFTPNDCRNYTGTANYSGGSASSSQPNFDATTNGSLVTRALTNPTCSVNAADVRVRFVQSNISYVGKRFIRYAFYDADQDLVGNPSPSLPVVVDAEDKGNASAQLRYVIGSLGAPRRPGNYEVWVYMGLAGGQETDLFRVARVPAGTSEIAVSLPETTIAAFPPLALSNGEPPRCKLVASDGERVYYAALETDPTAGVFSGLGSPASIDFTSDPPAVFFVSGGRGDEITALTQMDQQVLIAKRGCIGTLTVTNGVAVVALISKAFGCVSPASVQARDNRTYFMTERGLAMVTRWGNTNLGVPLYICGNVQDLYNTGMDRRFDALIVSAINEKRGQYLHTYRAIGESAFTKRISVEYSGEHGGETNPNAVFDDDSHAFVVCDGPRLTAMGSVPAASGQAMLVGGTEEGFLIWMDREDCQLHMMGEMPLVWGTSTPAHSSATPSTLWATCASTDVLDATLEGMRGALLRYADASGNEQTLPVLFVSGQTIYFAEVADAVPAVSLGMTLGAQVHHWESGWLDMGSPQWLKNVLFFDLVAKRESQGQLQVEFRHDFDEDTAIAVKAVDLGTNKKKVDAKGLDGTWLKSVIRSVPLTPKAQASISQAMWTLNVIDQDA